MNVLIAYSSPVVVDEDTHPNLRPSGTYNDGTQDWWLYLCTEVLTADRVIGAWESDGSVLVTATDEDGNPTAYYPIHSDYEAFIRPLGNDSGAATDSLDFHHWFGGGQRHIQAEPVADTLPQYPADRQPYVMTVERVWDDTPSSTGWGWTATLEFVDPSREPTDRGIYVQVGANAPYYAGDFALTEVGTDGDGNPIEKYQCKHSPGFVTNDPEAVECAVVFSGAEEGKATLGIETNSMTKYFFAVNQIPDVGQWVDSGQTVVAQYGTITAVSGDETAFPVGGLTRIDGVERKVLAYWLGGDGLELENPGPPFPPTGAAIEVWQ